MDAINRSMEKRLSLDALHCFVIVMKNHGNYTLAAKELQLTQGAVSTRMNKLKEKYGELFECDAQGAHFVGVGKILHDSAEEAVTMLARTDKRIRAEQAARAANERLFIAYSPSHVATVMNAIRVVLKERGGLNLLTEEADPATVAARLQERGGPELGIAYFQPASLRGLDAEQVASRPLALVTNKAAHPDLAKLDKVRAVDLQQEPLALLQQGPLRRLINEYSKGQKPKVVLESNMVASLLAAARVGFASTILPEFPEDSTFAVRKLEPAIVPATHLVWNVRAKRTAAAVAFADAVRRLAPGA
jgi:DNA-binding transcriptional LysR family regulator